MKPVMVVNGEGTSMVRPKRIDLETEPCPTVMGDGLGGVCRRGWQYWIEGAPVDALTGRVPRETATPETDPAAFDRC